MREDDRPPGQPLGRQLGKVGGVSGGIAIGYAHLTSNARIEVPQYMLDRKYIKDALARFDDEGAERSIDRLIERQCLQFNPVVKEDARGPDAHAARWRCPGNRC